MSSSPLWTVVDSPSRHAQEAFSLLESMGGFASQDKKGQVTYLAPETGKLYRVTRRELRDPLLFRNYSLWCSRTGVVISRRGAKRVWENEGRDWARRPWGYY